MLGIGSILPSFNLFIALCIAKYAELLLGDKAISITALERGKISSGYPILSADSIAAITLGPIEGLASPISS